MQITGSFRNPGFVLYRMILLITLKRPSHFFLQRPFSLSHLLPNKPVYDVQGFIALEAAEPMVGPVQADHAHILI